MQLKKKKTTRELWLDIPGYDGAYRVSNMGRIMSVGRENSLGVSVPERILSQSKNGYGYQKVCLSKNGVVKTARVHKLVALAFVENPRDLRCVNHIDENKENNRADNLEWCTHKYNSNYGGAQERKVRAMDYFAISRKKMKFVVQFDADGVQIREYQGVVTAAKENGFSRSNIASCARGKIPSANGYVWRYA